MKYGQRHGMGSPRSLRDDAATVNTEVRPQRQAPSQNPGCRDCGGPTVVRQNRSTREWFFGCLNACFKKRGAPP